MSRNKKTTIVRAKRSSNFTILSNHGLKNKELSYKAKGLLAYMLSLPDDWQFYVTELTNHATDGQSGIRSGLKELEEQGYLTRKQKRKKDGTFEPITWTIRDEPAFSPDDEKPQADKPYTDKPQAENHTLLNTNNTNDLYIQSTKETNMSGKPENAVERIPYKEIITYLNEKADRDYKFTANNNRKLIRERWNEGYRYEDFKQVIDNMTKLWGDSEKMKPYLRPITLFGNKFDEYRNKIIEQPNREVSEYADLF